MSIARERGRHQTASNGESAMSGIGGFPHGRDAGSDFRATGALETGSALSPTPLFELLHGFMAFKTLAAAHELDLFTRISGLAGVTAEQLSDLLGIESRPAEMLLTACAALGLLRSEEARYYNAPIAEAFLVAGRPGYLGGVIEMYDKRLYPGWANLTQAILTNRPTTWSPERQSSLFESEDPMMRALFWEAMHSQSSFTARLLGAHLDLSRFHRLLDVGGGSGAFAIELCRLYANLRATVYDLPMVAKIAMGKVMESGLEDKVAVVAGDFFADATLPEGHDLVLLSLVLHDWTPDKNRVILEKCYRALRSGGCLIISEQLVNNDKSGPPGAALKSLTMLIETEGRNYTPAEYASWLQTTGFTGIRTIRFNPLDSQGVVIAYKP